MNNRLAPPHFSVRYSARVMTPDRRITEALVTGIAKQGFIVAYRQALPVGSLANIEVNAPYRGGQCRLRAKTQVVYCRLLSGDRGAELELAMIFISAGDMHTYNNILQSFAEAGERNATG
ncbi:hypothetical protein [Teredinibacter turnerae]|uniref:hypothetical protein n=1 Tax=Teredinibacter turnerae TaxID=2426 RepID=UPI00055F74CC|nr:hypothetical protein [Teredinibacter turnerae]